MARIYGTAIEMVAGCVQRVHGESAVDEILVSEQSMMMYWHGKQYRITAQEMPDHENLSVGEGMAKFDEIMTNMARALARLVAEQGGDPDECLEFFSEHFNKTQFVEVAGRLVRKG